MIYNCFLYAYILFLLIIQSFNAIAQPTTITQPSKNSVNLLVKNWDNSEHLPTNSLTGLLLDDRGFLWITSFDGIFRFNGFRFDLFNADTSSELQTNRFIKIVKHTSGTLFVLSEDCDVYKISPDSLVFKRLSLPDYQKNESILNLIKIDNQQIFITTTNGILRLDENDNLIPFKSSLIHGNVHAINIDQFNTYWIQQGENAIYRLYKDKLQLVNNSNHSNSKSIFVINRDSVSYIALNSTIIKASQNNYSLYEFDEEIKRDFIYSFISFPNSNKFVLGTLGSGVFEFNPDKPSFLSQSSVKGLNFLSDLPNHPVLGDLIVTSNSIYTSNAIAPLFYNESIQIRSSLIDTDGCIWLATNGQGLFQLRINPFQTHRIETNLNSYSNNILSIAEDVNETVWAGTYSDGIYVKYPNTTLKKNTFNLNNNFNKFNISFFLSSQNRLFLTSYKQKLFEIIHDSISYFSIPIKDNEFVNSVLVDFNENLWISTEKGLFFKQDINSSQSDIIQITSVPSGNHKFVFQAPDSSFWIATEKEGLFKLRKSAESNQIKLSTEDKIKVRSITLDTHIRSPEHYQLWIASELNGLVSITVKNDSIQSYAITKKEGLPTSTIHKIIQDKNDNLWISSNIGLLLVRPIALSNYVSGVTDKLITNTFTINNGLPNNEFNGTSPYSGILRKNGNILFANQHGIVEFNPNELIKEKNSKTVYIDFIECDSIILYPNVDKPLEIPPNYTRLSFHFSLVSLSQTNRNYRYRLTPQHKKWITINTNETIDFVGLSHGEYRFELSALDVNGQWTQAVTQSFKVLPVWYHSSLFYIIVLILISLLIAGFVITKISSYKNKTFKLESTVLEKTKEVDHEKEHLELKNVELKSLLDTNNLFISNLMDDFQKPIKQLTTYLEKNVVHQNLNSLNTTTNPETIQSIKTVNQLNKILSSYVEFHSLQSNSFSLEKRLFSLSKTVENACNNYITLFPDKQKNIRFKAEHANVNSNLFFDPIFLQNTLFKFIDYFHELILNELSPKSPVFLFESSFSSKNQPLIRIIITHPEQSINSILIDICSQALALNVNTDSSVKMRTLHYLFSLFKLNSLQVSIDSFITDSLILNLVPESIQMVHHLATTDIQTDREAPFEIEQIKKKQVICIDDFKPFRILIKEILKNHVDVIEFSSALNAIIWLESNTPDLIICDYKMPDLDGIAFTKKVRAFSSWSFIPILMLSGQDSDYAKALAQENGVDVFLSKPILPDLLIKQVLILLKQKPIQHEISESSVLEKTESSVSISTSLSQTDRETLNSLLSLIEQNLSNPDFNVEDLASTLKTDRTSLFRKIKKLTDKSPSSLIQQMRIQKAMDMLIQKQGSVSDVAYACGYNSLSYFSQAFKNQTGMSPTDWLQHITNTTNSLSEPFT